MLTRLPTSAAVAGIDHVCVAGLSLTNDRGRHGRGRRLGAAPELDLLADPEAQREAIGGALQAVAVLAS